MLKNKGKMELRYYDVPQNEYLIAIHREGWEDVHREQHTVSHFHNLMEIGICRKGAGRMVLNDKVYVYGPGTITMIPADYPHATLGDDSVENCWDYLFIDSDKVMHDLYEKDIISGTKLRDTITQGGVIMNSLECKGILSSVEFILEELKSKKLFYRETTRGLLMVLMTQIARVHESSYVKADLEKPRILEQIRPGLEYIRDNYNKPIRIADVAAACHVSESHFRRVFEEKTGLTPIEYLNQIRIKNACELIQKSRASMEEIAQKVGFSTTSTFNRNFKRVMGTSPYHWKKNPGLFKDKEEDLLVILDED